MEEKYFNEVSKEWLLMKKLSVKYSTYIKYETLITNHFDKKFNQIKISEVNENMIASYFHELIAVNNFSTSTLKTIRYLLKAIIEYAQIKYEVKLVNFDFIKLGKSNSSFKLLTIEQRKALEIYCFQHHDKISLMILLSLYGGFRVGEVAGLKWEDIDLNTGLISVNRTIERLKAASNAPKKTTLMELEPKTTTSKRTVPIPQFILDYLKKYYCYQENVAEYYVYTNSKKIPDPRNIQYHFNKICKSLDFESSYHTLRHTYATNCVMNNVDIKSLSEILGHSNVSITLNLYVHSTIEFKKTEINKLKEPQYVTEL